VDGIKEVVKQIRLTPHHQLHFVFGVVSDKDISGMLGLLPKEAIYYFCKADLPRALDAAKLKEMASGLGLIGEAYASVTEAKEAALLNAKEHDLVFIGGSAFVVAEVV
jgi:dihydrofolate synthase/folylpolyglutamate synthase